MYKNKVISIFTDEIELHNYKNIISSLNLNESIDHKICIIFNNDNYMNSTNIDFNFNMNKSTKSLIDITNEILSCLENFLILENPTTILVYEDSITALNSALAAFYQNIPIIHINYEKNIINDYIHFSKKMNRKLISALSDFHCVNSENYKQMLINEGINNNKIFILNAVTSKNLISQIILPNSKREKINI